MSSIQFEKWHGLGNDFILINAVTDTINISAEQAMALCHRQMGIGADGIALIRPSDTADFRMQIINSDGTEPEMCGNAIRCVAKAIYQWGLSSNTSLSIETLAGIMRPELELKNGEVAQIKVDMGEPVQGPIEAPISIDDQEYNYTDVSMGNPHAVVFVEDIQSIALAELGPKFESHPVFPNKTNTEFVEILNPKEAHMKVWERGAGATLACGTGACATAVAAVVTGRLERLSTIHLPGGDLVIEWDETSNHVMMTGPAEKVFEGVLNL